MEGNRKSVRQVTLQAALQPSPAPLPAWSRPGSGPVADTEVSSFQAAVALAALDGLVRARPDWLGLFAMRQALDGAETICRLLRLGATREQLRDEEHWRRAGEAMTESGRIHALLRKAAAHRPDTTMLDRAVEAFGLAIEPGEKPLETAASSADCSEEQAPANRQNPITKAISAARAFHKRHMQLNTASHASRALDAGALLAADIALAHRLNWPRVIPLLCTADLTLFRMPTGSVFLRIILTSRLRPGPDTPPRFTRHGTACAGLHHAPRR